MAEHPDDHRRQMMRWDYGSSDPSSWVAQGSMASNGHRSSEAPSAMAGRAPTAGRSLMAQRVPDQGVRQQQKKVALQDSTLQAVGASCTVVYNFVTGQVAVKNIETNAGETLGAATAHGLLLDETGWSLDCCLGASIQQGRFGFNSGSITGLRKLATDSVALGGDLREVHSGYSAQHLRKMTKEEDLKSCHEFIHERVQLCAFELLKSGRGDLCIGDSGVVLDDREMQKYERAQRLQKAQREGEMICVSDPIMGGQKWISKPEGYDERRRRSPTRAGRAAAVPREGIWQARAPQPHFR